MGIFTSYDYIIFEIREADTYMTQSWSRYRVNDNQEEWHHVAAVWRCNSDDDFMQVFLDGVPSSRRTFSNGCVYHPDYECMWIGKNYYYGSSFSVMDEFKIHDYPFTEQDLDKDQDSYFYWQDCDDDNENANPDMMELCRTSFDDDCDGIVNEGCDEPGTGSPIYKKPTPITEPRSLR